MKHNYRRAEYLQDKNESTAVQETRRVPEIRVRVRNLRIVESGLKHWVKQPPILTPVSAIWIH